MADHPLSSRRHWHESGGCLRNRRILVLCRSMARSGLSSRHDTQAYRSSEMEGNSVCRGLRTPFSATVLTPGRPPEAPVSRIRGWHRRMSYAMARRLPPVASCVPPVLRINPAARVRTPEPARSARHQGRRLIVPQHAVTTTLPPECHRPVRNLVRGFRGPWG